MIFNINLDTKMLGMKKANGTKYSRMEQVKFVEDSLPQFECSTLQQEQLIQSPQFRIFCNKDLTQVMIK